MQLLFFDTFSHDTSGGDLNLDLVQFPSPVRVREVRIIPLGARVSANFPGGVRLGATNPAKFDLEFFVNNLRAAGASTFESLGVLAYNQNGGVISLVCPKNLSTDGLVLRGRYAAVTLAVYGQVSDVGGGGAAAPITTAPSVTTTASAGNNAAKQGTAEKKNAVVVAPDHLRIKEEPVRPPESPLPDGNGRTIGESYAAVWTAKHSEEALKAEPPEEWMQNLKTEGGWGQHDMKVEVKKEAAGDDYSKITPENNNLIMKQEKLSPRQPASDQDWSNRKKDIKPRYPSSGSRDRSRERSAGRYRSQSPLNRSPGYQFPPRSREASHSRYRSRSPDSRDLRRSREGSRDPVRSRDGSQDSYMRRSYDKAKDYRRNSRDPSPDRYRGSRDRSMERDKYSSNRQLSPVRGGRPTSHGPRHHSPPVNGLPSRHLSPPRPPRPRSRTPRSRSPRLRDKRIYDRSPQDSGGYRRDGSREYSPDRKSLPPRSKDYAPPRSPRTREYSRSRSPGPPPREYDRGSHHSVSTNRRHFSPRRSMSPRNLRSASPRRRSLSRSPRYAAGGPRSRSRSPFANRRPSGAASNSPSDSLWKKRTYSPAGGGGGGRSRYSRSPPPPPATVHRPLSRNGHLESYSPDRRQRTKSPPAKLAAAVANEPDVLDNVSDISEGDIPDLPDDVQGEGETEVEQQQQQQQPLQQQKQMLATESTPPPTVGSRNYISREDIEEISDEEAEWSDDFEPLAFSDLDLDLVAADLENPVRVFDATTTCLRPLRVFAAPRFAASRTRTSPGAGAAADISSVWNIVRRLDAPKDDLVLDEKWIEGLESLTGLVEEVLANNKDVSLSSAVIRIAFSGLNYDFALQQARPTNKVRHIKSGIKYVLQLLNCGHNLVNLLIHSGLISILWNLFHREHMTIPIKLLILRAIDRALDTRRGMDMFVEHDGQTSLYLEVVDTLAKDEKTRTKFALTSLLNKVHLHQLLLELHRLAADPSLQDQAAGEDVAAAVFDRLEAGLAEMTRVFSNLDTLLVQPARHLPCNRRYQAATPAADPNDPARSYFSVMRAGDALNLVNLLLAGEMTGPNINILARIKELTTAWASTLPGLVFMTASTKETSTLVSLLQRPLPANQPTQSPCQFPPAVPAAADDNGEDATAEQPMEVDSEGIDSGDTDIRTSLAAAAEAVPDNANELSGDVATTAVASECDSVSAVSEILPLTDTTRTLPGPGDAPNPAAAPLAALSSTDDDVPSIERTRKNPPSAVAAAKTCFVEDWGSWLAHRVYALQFIDQLRFEDLGCEDRKGMETPAVLAAAQSLYGMTLSVPGREAVVEVLALADNMDVVISLTNHSNMEGDKDMKKSAIRGYANQLLLTTIRCSENVDFLAKYAKQLDELGRHDELSKLCQLIAWIRPCLQPDNLTAQGIPALVEVLKRNIESNTPVNQEVITALRILANLAVPNYNRKSACETKEPALETNHAALVLYSQEGVDTLTGLVGRLTAGLAQPGLHTSSLVGGKGALILAVLRPALALLKTILESLISARGSAFKDTTALPALLDCYALVHAVPSTSPFSKQAEDCRAFIVSSLLAFTQPPINPDKDDLSKSLWTSMMRAVLEHATSCPANYLSGLQLLSALLPLALPLPAPRPLLPDEEAEVLKARNLWSAHLLPCEAELARAVGLLAGHVYPPLVGALRRVVGQLTGLAPPTATTVLLAVMRAASAALNGKHLTVAARLMAELVWLTSQPHLKVVMVHSVAEEAVRTELSRTIEVCFTQGPARAQESAIILLQNLCDPGITLHQSSQIDSASTPSPSSWEAVLSDSLPDTATLRELGTVLLNPFTCELRTNFSIQLLTMRTLVMLTRTEFTFSILKTCLNAKNRNLFSFLRKLSVELKPEVDGCLAAIAATLELLQRVLQRPAEEEGTEDSGEPAAAAGDAVADCPARTSALSLEELAWVIQYTQPQDSEAEAADRRRVHPLNVLQNRLADHAALPGVSKIQASLSDLLTRLEKVGEGVEGVAVEEELCLPPATPLLTQWSWRQVAEVCGRDEAIAKLGICPQTEGPATSKELESERESVDLVEVCARHLVDTDLAGETSQVVKETNLLALDDRKKKVKKSLMETKTAHNKNIISTFKSGGAINLRSQRYNRSGGGGGGNFSRPDSFRQRPPNTSRPPSLHVDDFLVLELKGQQPTGPTGYNKQSMKAANELFAQREAAAALKPPAQLREATREPVLPPSFRGRGGRGGERGRGGYRNGNDSRPRGGGGGFHRRDSRGWSPDGYRTSEPRDLGREARPGPREDRRFRGGRGDRRGGWDRGRGRDKFGGGRGGKDDRPRHSRNFTR